MKSIKCTKYGAPDVLQIVEIEKPTPYANEVLIKNYATSVTAADCRIRGFDVPPTFWIPARFALGFTKPRKPILGGELSGVVEAVGKNVKRFKVGDEVFAFTSHDFGAYAEYVKIKENNCIAIKPKNLSFEQSAVLSFGGITALFFLEKAKVKVGEKVLVYGASGCVGTYTVQLAKHFGATVTGICSTSNLEIVKQIGADHVIDYTKTDLTEIDEQFDVFFDAVGKDDVSKAVKLLKPNGRYVHLVATPLDERKMRKQLGKSIQLIGGSYTANAEQAEEIRKLAEQGAISPVIGKSFSFEDIVSAHKYASTGHKLGCVAVKII